MKRSIEILPPCNARGQLRYAVIDASRAMPDYSPRAAVDRMGAPLPDVVIALFNETWWYVKGDAHIDDVLAGKEADQLVVSLVTCGKWLDVMQLWETPEVGQMPWAINPKVIARLKTRARTTVA